MSDDYDELTTEELARRFDRLGETGTPYEDSRRREVAARLRSLQAEVDRLTELNDRLSDRLWLFIEKGDASDH